MNTTINYAEQGKLYTPAQAEATAQTLRNNDPDWTYIVKHDPKGTGYSFIEIYDEDGFYIGKSAI
jgi:hypothetical protein